MEKLSNYNVLKPKQYFIKILWKGSKDLRMLEKLVEDSNNKINWEKLRWYVKIKDNKTIESIYYEESLDLSWTRIKDLWKIEKVWWNFNLNWLKYLNNLWNLKEVGGDMDVRWTSIEIQKTIIKKIKSGSLKVKWDIFFGWNSENVENLLCEREIPWNLDLRGENIWTQLKSILRYNLGKLYLKWKLYIDENLVSIDNNIWIFPDKTNNKNIYNKYWFFNWTLFIEKYGDNLEKLEDKQKKAFKEFFKIYIEVFCSEIIDIIIDIINNKDFLGSAKEEIENISLYYMMEKKKIEEVLWEKIDLDCRK